jgi:hypothetical protein
MHVHKYKYIELLQVLTSIWRWNLWFGLLTLLLGFFPSGMEMVFIGCSLLPIEQASLKTGCFNV